MNSKIIINNDKQEIFKADVYILVINHNVQWDIDVWDNETFESLYDNQKIIYIWKSNILSLTTMSDDNHVIWFLNKQTNEIDYEYIDNFQSYCYAYIPSLNITIKQILLDWQEVLQWDPLNMKSLIWRDDLFDIYKN